jgi:metal-responsive CopG/Arc/MetJ family transcriptional regulator
VAKVMISLPDDLLARLDERARNRGMTRSGLLRTLVERELDEDEAARRSRILEILATAAPHGSDSAAFIREIRDTR